MCKYIDMWLINDRTHGILMTGGDYYFWIINS